MLRVVLCIGLLLPLTAGLQTSGDAAAISKGCGLTTLDGTIAFSDELRAQGQPLECGPGQPLKIRRRLASDYMRPHRAERRTPMISFFTIADVQLADEEAPARAEWSDNCDQPPFGGSGFRPHETMVPHLLNAHLTSASKIARNGSPIMGDEFSFAIGLGDLADNMQFNEIRWIIDLFDGAQIVNPDSGRPGDVVPGADGYDGVQAEDPEGAPADPMTTPVDGERILDLANEPFWAHGLRLRPDKPIPWYTLPGNHDVKVQGTAPNSDSWLDFINEYNQGNLKIMDELDAEERQEACDGGYADPDFYRGLFDPSRGGAQAVPADDRRRLVRRHEWAEEHFRTTGVPDGHGYNENRCRNKEGELLERVCYSFDKGVFHFIGLDSNPDEGLETGNIDHPQWLWLRRELRQNSKRYYNAKGEVVRNPNGDNHMIVVFAHHPTESMRNEETENGHTGPQFLRLLQRFPNVILNANGHTHKNKIWMRRNKDLGTGYWELNTSAVADYPTQSRTVEIVNNHDGTISIFGVVFNADVPVDARQIDWSADDHTHETEHGKEHNINEDWLASFGQEVLFYDPQQDLTKLGNPRDRNVELLLRAPAWFRRRG